MKRSETNAPTAPSGMGIYSNAVGFSEFEKLVVVSGQVPQDAEGNISSSFAEQARQVWRNIFAQLREQSMDVKDIVKVTMFLTDRKFVQENRDIRREMLGEYMPAFSAIICELVNEQWLLEIEVVAAK